MEDPWADGVDNEDTRLTRDQRLEMEEGYTFCDSTRETEAELQANMMREADLLEKVRTLESLIATGEASSTCDQVTEQGINETLRLYRTFWSSTGSGADADEFLLYRLRAPLCEVQFVRVAVFRAEFHHGAPIYPPATISFAVGATPHALCKVEGAPRPVRATARWQTFELPASACIGQYLRVNLHGKRQRQESDGLFYTAICAVTAHGRAPPLPLPALAPWRLHAQPRLQLDSGCGVGACAAERVWGAAAQQTGGRSPPYPQRPFSGQAQAQPGLEGGAAGAGGAGASDALPQSWLEEPTGRAACSTGSGAGGAGVQQMEE